MRQAAERAALAMKAFDATRPEQGRVEQLHCDARFVTTVTAMREPHGAHAALPKMAVEHVVADDLTLQTRLRRRSHYRVFEKSFLFHLGVLRHKVGEVVGLGNAAAAKLRDALRARRRIERQQLIQQRTELVPA